MPEEQQSPGSDEPGLSFIEQLHAISLQKCENPRTPHLIGHSVSTDTALLTKASCGMWSCATCAARMVKKWIAKVINGVNRIGGEWFMFTLTAHEKWRGASSVKNLRQGWKKLYNRMRRARGVSQYVKVWEMHRDGSFHLHGMVNQKIPVRWLKNNARQCGLGYQVEIHHVTNAGMVAGYISKYFLKSEGVLKDGEIWPKGLRRIEVSRAWPKLEKMPILSDYAWAVTNGRQGQLDRAEFLRHHGVKIIDIV